MTVLTTPLMAGTIIDDQIALESEAVSRGVERYRKLARDAIERGDASSLKPAERWIVHWFEPLAAAITLEKASIKNGEYEEGRSFSGGPMLMLDADRIAVIALHNVVGWCLRENTPALRAVAYDIGRDVLAECHADLLKEMQRENGAKYRSRMATNPDDDKRQRDERQVWRDLTFRFKNLGAKQINRYANNTLAEPAFLRRHCYHVGLRLCRLVYDYCGAGNHDEGFVSAFSIFNEQWSDNGRPRHTTRIAMRNNILDDIEKSHSMRELLRPRYLPMLVPAYPWQIAPEESPDAEYKYRVYSGGYVQIRTPVISKPTAHQRRVIFNTDIGRTLDCLNVLGRTGFTTNEGVFSVVDRLWQEGGGQLGIPRRNPTPLPPRIPDDAGKDAIAAVKKERAKIHDANIAEKGERQMFLSRHEVAERFVGKPMYFPHQMDFRGRCYPIPPHLNHQGDDLCRGLMQFRKDVPLAEGRKWIHVHAANCFGVDKVGYADRIKWSLDNFLDMAESARNPHGHDFWTRADKPWQFLAACQAINGQHREASHIPIQFDGSANGLQWYAAIGRDSDAAAQVNLIDSDTPANLYGTVSLEVKRKVALLAVADNNQAARDLLPWIQRSTVKQPVMTVNYGVTLVGARGQCANALREAGAPEHVVKGGSMLLAKTILEAVADVCKKATEIMDWLRDVAKIVTAKGHALQWTTPLGWPVVQPYRKWKHYEVGTAMYSLKVHNYDDEPEIDAAKQIDGFAPNYIHSLDATHLLMTAKRCADEGIDFAGVHDSYWCHAANADRMNVILREVFVEINRRDLLADLWSETEKRYQLDLPVPPARGNFDIENVLKSTYFFN